MADVARIREAILAANLESAHSGGREPNPADLYLPLSHRKALRPETHLVIGGRGVGKSFWTAALKSSTLRKIAGVDINELNNLDVFIGHAENAAHDYPSRETFAQLMQNGADPYHIWCAVILRWVVGRMEDCPVPLLRHGTETRWADTVEWVRDNPEPISRLMLLPRDWRGMVVFDALDVTANNWQTMDQIVRGLLRAVLWLRGYRDLYGKIFLRTDQAERNIFDFPDASKIRATEARLSWEENDLYGLMWHRLINAPEQHGECLRQICPYEKKDGIFVLPPKMMREGAEQREVFEKLAGQWMGKDHRRGVPYTWIVSHLSDTKREASPRSFLVAIRHIVEDSRDRYPDHEYAMHYESIKRGIQRASTIRVHELYEDYPWVKPVFEPLAGLNVPCEFKELCEKWGDKFPDGPAAISVGDTEGKLPPEHAERDWAGILVDLSRLGLLSVKQDGRIDMPDLYRVGFRLGRKGGVKPGRR